ncbi:MAG TPA: OsmC family protein [Polyangia bacterium]|jgi:putative redox protein|nr:OsmC family protein [Polyangia bacterium]
MTTSDESAPETLIAAAHLESSDVRYTQTIRVGHHVVPCDEPAARGGADAGPSPVGLLLAALAGCTSITLRMYADRKGWELGQVKVSLKLLRSPSADRVERTIQLGGALAPEQLARLLEIADKTPVTKMLRHGMEIATKIA